MIRPILFATGVALAVTLGATVTSGQTPSKTTNSGVYTAAQAERGKKVFEAKCTACHDTNQITRSSGYTREGWRELIQTMINLSGTPAGETITKYLAAHFPAREDRKPTLVRGESAITFREWKVPTLGQRSRDSPQGTVTLPIGDCPRSQGQDKRQDRQGRSQSGDCHPSGW